MHRARRDETRRLSFWLALHCCLGMRVRESHVLLCSLWIVTRVTRQESALGLGIYHLFLCL